MLAYAKQKKKICNVVYEVGYSSNKFVIQKVNFCVVHDVAEFVQTVICQALFVCGLIAPLALRVVEPWQLNVVVVWGVLGKQGCHCYS